MMKLRKFSNYTSYRSVPPIWLMINLESLPIRYPSSGIVLMQERLVSNRGYVLDTRIDNNAQTASLVWHKGKNGEYQKLCATKIVFLTNKPAFVVNITKKRLMRASKRTRRKASYSLKGEAYFNKIKLQLIISAVAINARV